MEIGKSFVDTNCARMSFVDKPFSIINEPNCAATEFRQRGS
jgi:hypothetical protein